MKESSLLKLTMIVLFDESTEVDSTLIYLYNLPALIILFVRWIF